MRAERDTGRRGTLLSIRGGTIGAEPRYRSLSLLLATPIQQIVSSTSAGAGCHTWCKRMGFVRVAARDRYIGQATRERRRKPRQLARGMSMLPLRRIKSTSRAEKSILFGGPR
jgi:hypothetical protein